jgi:hypothetical protein
MAVGARTKEFRSDIGGYPERCKQTRKLPPNIALQPTGCDRAVFALWKQKNAFPFYPCHFQVPPAAELFLCAAARLFGCVSDV